MFNIIVATSLNNAIGLNNIIPWKCKEDMKYFSDTTFNSVVIMGRNTYQSIGKPLKNRINFVISSTNFTNEVPIFRSLNDALNDANTLNKNIFVIGGSRLYEEALNHKDLNKIYYNVINVEVEGNFVTFPYTFGQMIDKYTLISEIKTENVRYHIFKK